MSGLRQQPLGFDIKSDRYAHVNYCSEESNEDASYDGDADDDHSFASAREKVEVDLEFIVNSTVDRTRYTFDRLLRICADDEDEDEDEDDDNKEDNKEYYNIGINDSNGNDNDDASSATSSSEELLSVATHDPTSEDDDDDDLSYASYETLQGPLLVGKYEGSPKASSVSASPRARARARVHLEDSINSTNTHNISSITSTCTSSAGDTSNPNDVVVRKGPKNYPQQQQQQDRHRVYRSLGSPSSPISPSSSSSDPPALDELTVTSNTYCSNQDCSVSSVASVVSIATSTATPTQRKIAALNRKVSAIQEIDNSIETIREIKARLRGLRRFSVEHHHHHYSQKTQNITGHNGYGHGYSNGYGYGYETPQKSQSFFHSNYSTRSNNSAQEDCSSSPSPSSSAKTTSTGAAHTSMLLGKKCHSSPNDHVTSQASTKNNLENAFDRVKEIKSRLRSLEKFSSRKVQVLGENVKSEAHVVKGDSVDVDSADSADSADSTILMIPKSSETNENASQDANNKSPIRENKQRNIKTTTKSCSEESSCCSLSSSFQGINNAVTSLIPYRDELKMNIVDRMRQQHRTEYPSSSSSPFNVLTEYEAAMLRASDNMVEALLKLSREVLLFLFALFTIYILYLTKRDRDFNSLQLELHQMKMFARAITIAHEKKQWRTSSVAMARKVQGPLRRFFFRS